MPPAALAAGSMRSPYLACSLPSSRPFACVRRLLRSRSNLLELPPTDPVRSDELLLHLELALDKGLDDLVDAGVGDEPERFGARGAPAPAASRRRSRGSAQWLKLCPGTLVHASRFDDTPQELFALTR